MDGGGGGGFSSVTAPLTWSDFLERMRHPSAAEFVKSIKSFIMSFTNKDPNPEKDSAAVQEFLTNMEGAFRAHSLWAGCSEEELECAGEGLEKYVMTKLFNRAFASLPEERKHDEDLSDKMALVQKFIRPENLDIKPTFQNETSWLLAQKELQKINIYKAPRDKLVCILNCCKVINNLLLNASLSSSENPPGADEFLPVLIYVTIKANPPQLHSNLLYIQRYRRQSRLVSEAAYYFTNILSAESFIWSIDAQALSMDELEYQKNMEAAKAVLLGLSSETKDISSQSTYENKFPSPSEVQVDRSERIKSKVSSDQAIDMNLVQPQLSEAMKDPARNDTTIANKQSASVLETKGAHFLLKEEQMSNYFNEFPFLYASVGNLTIDDVETLLDSYKQLVLKYVSLSKGLGVETLPSSLSEKPAHVDNGKESYDANGKEAGQENDQFNKFFESVENSKVTEESAQAQSVNEPIDDKETKSYNDKFDEFCEAVESSIANTSGEVDGAIYSAPTVEPVVDSSPDNTQLQV